jgi:tetratricopeptide (TPR) repeat protein
MRYQKLALGIVAFAGKSRINSVGKFAVVLLLSLTLPVLVVAESREVAIAQTQTGEERKLEALRLNELGFEQFNKNQFQEALETFQKALIIVREIGDTTGEGFLLNNIGEVYRILEQYPKALEFYQQAF